ncbi:exonuclease family domain protein, partial [Escherichia coli EC1850]
SRCSHCH